MFYLLHWCLCLWGWSMWNLRMCAWIVVFTCMRLWHPSTQAFYTLHQIVLWHITFGEACVLRGFLIYGNLYEMQMVVGCRIWLFREIEDLFGSWKNTSERLKFRNLGGGCSNSGEFFICTSLCQFLRCIVWRVRCAFGQPCPRLEWLSIVIKHLMVSVCSCLGV